MATEVISLDQPEDKNSKNESETNATEEIGAQSGTASKTSRTDSVGTKGENADRENVGSKPGSQTESRPGSRRDSRPDSKPGSRTDSNGVSQPSSKAESKYGSPAGSKISSKAESKTESKGDTRTDSTSNARPVSSSATDPAVGPDGKPLSVMEAHGYIMGAVLGSGSYATVKLAFSSRHKSKVAVKIISKKKSPASYVAKFLPREIQAVRIIKHPNIICFLQSIETTNRVYLIMEVADGGDVLKAVRQTKHIDEATAAKWFGQSLGAMKYCHNKGVVHRDLKCENLLLDQARNVKVTDFGFARVYDMKQPLEPSETFCGSYPYAPPEILRGIPYHPMSADYWSLGVILFTMVFGRLPFDDHNHRTLVKQVLAGPQFPMRHSYQMKVSQECRECILKLLKPMPHRATFEDIEKDIWFSRMGKQSMQVKNKDSTFMEVVKEEETGRQSSEAFPEF